MGSSISNASMVGPYSVQIQTGHQQNALFLGNISIFLRCMWEAVVVNVHMYAEAHTWLVTQVLGI